ncbi:MAG: ATP-binding protein [Acidobacteriota bacterium]
MLHRSLMDSTRSTSSLPSAVAWWRRERWRYGAAAFAVGMAYSAIAMWTGVDIRIEDRDVSLLVGALLEVSFGVLGYLLGLTIEARRGERRAAAESEQRVRELADRRARLAQTEKLASLGQLASAVAHEVRNPLAILRSMAQNLGEDLSPDQTTASATCADMIEEIDRLARVTAQLVDFARPMTPRPTSVAIAALVDRVGLLVDPLLRPRRLRFVADGDPRQRLDADPDLLCQVLLGLIHNAIDASPENGTLRIAWRQRDATLDLTVHDDGEGVPEALQERIFEPFFTTRDDGHGLGLAVARQIAEAHGGRLVVASDVEHGGGFRLSLPGADTADEARVA